jgi:HK97 family phage prohead protease
MQRIIELPRAARGAEVRAASFNEAENTVDVIWTTGATVRRRSYYEGPYDEELVVERGAVRLDRLNNGAPLLNTHSDWDLDDVIGSVVPGTARLSNGVGLATVKLSTAPGDADNVQKIRDGIIRNISVGYIIHRVEKIEADDGSVPVWRVVDWEPIEISAVPVPADPGAQIRSEKSGAASTFRCLLTDRAPAPHIRRARMAMRARLAGAV